jgi:hypothetical protein
VSSGERGEIHERIVWIFKSLPLVITVDVSGIPYTFHASSFTNSRRYVFTSMHRIDGVASL